MEIGEKIWKATLERVLEYNNSPTLFSSPLTAENKS